MGIGKGVAKEARTCPFLVFIVTSMGDFGSLLSVRIRGFLGVRFTVFLRSMLRPWERVQMAFEKLAVERICNLSLSSSRIV